MACEKLSISLILGFVLSGVASQGNNNIVEKYFDQKLDHSNDDNSTWSQVICVLYRYYQISIGLYVIQFNLLCLLH